MKSNMLCAFLTAMLLFSAAAFGELVPTGTGESSDSVSASASHGGDPYDYKEEEGDNGYYTTEEDEFDYHNEAYAFAWAKAVEADGWVVAQAVAYAEAGPVIAVVTWNFDTTNEDSDSKDPDPDTGQKHFDAYSGVYAWYVVIAYAEIEEGSYSSAGASAYAYAESSMDFP